MHTRKLTHENHRRELDGMRYVYPVLSRRAGGISIGVNLNPDKACNFDCIYCQVDRAVPGVRGVNIHRLGEELARVLSWAIEGSLFTRPPFDTVSGPLRRVNDIAFSGDGEPTASPVFEEAVRRLVDIKERLALSSLKTILITNGSLLDRPTVKTALEIIDRSNGEIWVKLDAGSEAFYRSTNRSAVRFDQVLANIAAAARQRPVVIQTMLMDIRGQGPQAAEIDAYIERLRSVLESGGAIRLVQIYSVARKPPVDHVQSLPVRTLEGVATEIQQRLKIPVQVFPGSSMYLSNRGFRA